MSIKSYLQKWVAKSWSGFGPDRWYAGDQSWFGHNSAGEVVTPERSLSVSTVAACVQLLSNSVASLPCFTLREDGRSKLKAPEHPNWNLLLKQPNDYMTAFVFWRHVMVHILFQGNSYSYIQRAEDGSIAALWPLRYGTVTVEINNGDMTYHYAYGGTKQDFSSAEILHFKNLSLNGIIGLSTLQMAREGIGEAAAASKHAGSLWRNSARPGMAIKVPNIRTDIQKANLAEQWAMKFEGALRHGKSVVLDSEMDIQPIGFSSEDAQFLESREFSVREICRWFNVPAHLVGDTTRTSYNSSENEMLSFLTHSLRPHLVNLESEINTKLFDPNGNVCACFDTRALQRADTAARYTSYSQGLTAGFLTVADVREWEGLPFIEGTDKLLQPANMMSTNPNEEVTDGTAN